jgi:DNA-binding protein Fis
MFVAELPSSGSVPTEAELLAFGRQALSVQPGKAAEVARIASLLSTKPTPGKASETATHEGSAVTSAWLPSGARVNHRFMDIQKDSVTVTITLAAGAINEVSANRGISEAAALAWQRPATSSLTSTQLREFMMGKKVNVISAGAMEALTTARWIGNVRELENVIERAVVLSATEQIDLDDLPAEIRNNQKGGADVELFSLAHLPYAQAKKLAMRAFERRYLSALLDKSAGNVSSAARAAGVDRSNFRRLLKQYEVAGRTMKKGEGDDDEFDDGPDTGELSM